MTTAYSGDGITFPDSTVQATAPRVGMVNRIINGAMTIDQRNVGAAVTSGFPVDRFTMTNTTDGTFSAQQDSSAPSGFTNSLKITITGADTSVTTTQYLSIRQKIEGFNISDFGLGTASAKTFTVSFWVRSSLTGVFGGAAANSAANRAYPFTYTISVADTWEQKTVTIAGDTTGTWLTTNGTGLQLFFGLGAGPDRSGTAGVWNSNNNTSATGATSVVGTNGATFYITGVQLEKGSTATDFEYVDYGRQLQMCQRYYEWGVASGSGYAGVTAIFDAGSTSNIDFKASKRAVPTMTNMTLSGNQYPNNQSNSVPRYENGFSRAFRFTTEHNTTFWNVTTGAGGSTGVAGHQIIWNASAEL